MTHPHPNIIIVLADDLGYGDIGCYNPDSRIPTPHMDALAKRGMRFSDAHSPSAVCTPSRYGLLTGDYGWRGALPYGVLYGYEPPLISPGCLTLPRMLQTAGYETTAIGKWHLGLGFSAKATCDINFKHPLPWPEASKDFEDCIDFHKPLKGGPTSLGFDSFFGTSGCSTCQPPYAFIENNHFVVTPSVYDNNPPYTGRPGYMAPDWQHHKADTTFTERAVNFINQPHDKPFFMYLAASAPHEPCTPDVVPDFAKNKSNAGSRGDLVWLFDWMVGQVINALKTSNQLHNTLIIVTSDNGALPGDRISDSTQGTPAGMAAYHTYNHHSSGAWRGFKSHVWEGGHREPLIVSWPGVVPQGGVSDALFCLTDVMASIAGLLGIALPADVARDSFDLSATFLNLGARSERVDMIHHSQKGVFSLRAGRWKCVFGTEGSGGWAPPADDFPAPVVFDDRFPDAAFLADLPAGQLYDLQTDPAEQRNLWHARFDVVIKLAAQLDAYRRGGRSVGADRRALVL